MDIQINAAQGRGKSAIARQIAGTVGGQIFEPQLFDGAQVNLSKVSRDIVEARADVVIFDSAGGWDGWSIESIKQAVQSARQSLNRNIVALYCLQDSSASVGTSAQTFIPYGFVSENGPAPVLYNRNAFKNGSRVPSDTSKQDEALRNEIKAAFPNCEPIIDHASYWWTVYGLGARRLEPSADTREADIASYHECAPSMYLKPAVTAASLLAQVREIYAAVWAAGLEVHLKAMYAHFGVDSITALPAMHWPEAERRLSNIITRNKCRLILLRATDEGHIVSSRQVMETHGSTRLSCIPDENIPALYSDLCFLYGTD